MGVLLSQVYGKAKAYVDALCKVPPSQFAGVPTGGFGRDFNTLRRLTLQVLPQLDERLLGKDIPIRQIRGGSEICDASFIEIQTYARQILEQLAHVIAIRGGRARNTRLRKLGLDHRRSGGKSPSPSSDAPKWWRELRPRAGCIWTPDEDKELVRKFQEGLPLEKIAKSLGRGAFSLEVRLYKLGKTKPGGE